MKGVLIYIIIALFVIISSIRKKAKKAAESQPPQANPTPSTPDTWAEVLRELGKNINAPAEQAAPAPAKANEAPDNISQTEEPNPAQPFAAQQTPQEEKKKEPAKEENPITGNEIGATKYNLKNKDTLRQAFIYSEILNRKYT